MLAGDRLGSLAPDPRGRRASDMRACTGSSPACPRSGCPRAGYSRDAWKALAETAVLLATGTAPQEIGEIDPLRAEYARLARGLGPRRARRIARHRHVGRARRSRHGAGGCLPVPRLLLGIRARARARALRLPRSATAARVRAVPRGDRSRRRRRPRAPVRERGWRGAPPARVRDGQGDDRRAALPLPPLAHACGTRCPRSRVSARSSPIRRCPASV